MKQQFNMRAYKANKITSEHFNIYVKSYKDICRLLKCYKKRTQKDNNWRYLKLATIFTYLKWTNYRNYENAASVFCHNLPNICSCSVIVLIVVEVCNIA